jgi:hypothetical protein
MSAAVLPEGGPPMWQRLVSWLRRTRLGTWFAAKPWRVVIAGCFVLAALVFAVGAKAPSPFVQNVAADLLGGLIAGLVIFGLADVAFGFTERREKQHHALRIAFRMLFLEMLDNSSELSRIVRALRGSSLARDDVVFGTGERLKAENWQLFVQSPSSGHLDPDLFFTVGFSYYVSRLFVQRLKNSRSDIFAASPKGWKHFCSEHLAEAENAKAIVDSALEQFRTAHDSVAGT